MIDLVESLKSASTNQLLVAGVGTAMTAHVMNRAKAWIDWTKGIVRGQVIQTLTVKQSSATITNLTKLLSQHRVHLSGRSYSVFGDSAGLNVGYGHGYARWKKTWILFDLHAEQNGNHGQSEVLTLTFYTRRKALVSDFVAEAMTRFQPPRDTIGIYHRDGGWTCTRRKKRPISTVFANGDMTAEIVAKVRWFIDNEAWYVSRGLNYKLVILLYGQPGTGKTSLIQAVASEFNRDLYCIDSLWSVASSVGRVDDGILAIEDIDTLANLKRPDLSSILAVEKIPATPAGVDRLESLTKPKGSNPFDDFRPEQALHLLLNTLDGLATPHGLITIITTNHIEALDPALVRPCRIDLLLEVKALDYDAFREMFASYYDGAVPAIDEEDYRPMTGATLQQVFMTNPLAAGANAEIAAHCPRKPVLALMAAE